MGWWKHHPIILSKDIIQCNIKNAIYVLVLITRRIEILSGAPAGCLLTIERDEMRIYVKRLSVATFLPETNPVNFPP